MSLQVEANIVYFPQYRPYPAEGETPEPLTNEVKQRVYHQQAEIHMINIGPVTQEILDSRLIDADFGGVSFSWNKETSEYSWTREDADKPLPLKYMGQLLAELRKVGYANPSQWYRPDTQSTSEYIPVSKEIWQLEKKF